MATAQLDAIARRSEPLTFKRPTQGAKRVIGGKMQTPLGAVTPFDGEVQPSSPKHLPQGTQTRDVVVIFTGTEIVVDDEIKSTLANSIIEPDEVYVVQTAENWRAGEFFEATALRRKGNIA